MRYVQLRAFHHVALSGSFSQAARALRLTQPAISDQVRWLEEAYDVALFVRKRRQIELTPAGARLLVATRRLFDAEGEALGVLQEERSLRAGTLRIAADSVDHVLEALTVFQSRFPGIQIRIVGGNSEEIVEDLLNYQVDIGVLGDLRDDRPFEVLGETVTPIPFTHGRFHVYGFRIGGVAYCTDVSGIPDRSWSLLEGLDVLILGALRPGKPHPSHFSLEQALDVIARVKPRQAYLTHMAHTMDYDALTPTLPPGVALGYDGLAFRF